MLKNIILTLWNIPFSRYLINTGQILCWLSQSISCFPWLNITDIMTAYYYSNSTSQQSHCAPHITLTLAPPCNVVDHHICNIWCYHACQRQKNYLVYVSLVRVLLCWLFLLLLLPLVLTSSLQIAWTWASSWWINSLSILDVVHKSWLTFSNPVPKVHLSIQSVTPPNGTKSQVDINCFHYIL